MFIYQWGVISKRLQQVAVIHYRRKSRVIIQAVDKLISERGFSLLELILVMVVTGILSSVLIIPFISGLKQGTRPEVYTTVTFLAQKKIEEYRSEGYTSASNDIDSATNPLTTTSTVVKGGRTYTETVKTEYSDPDNIFNHSASSTEFIKVTATVSNVDVPEDVSLWTILAKDFYDPDAN